MYRLFFHFISSNCVSALLILVYSILILAFSQKILALKSRILRTLLLMGPLLIGVIHFICNFLHVAVKENFYMFGYMYIFAFVVSLMIFFSKKKKVFKIYKTLVIILGIFCYLTTFYKTILIENVHNLTYSTYTESFKKTLEILQKEYVLNEHKKIDYELLYKKYYPNIQKAELNEDEQLYFKTMFELSKEFKDGHFVFNIYYTNLEDTIDRYTFANDYQNQNYGFASMLLSNNEVVAVLVDEESEAYQLGLRDGMTITQKNNQDVQNLIDEIITPMSAFPVYEDERLINSFYLFATGENIISVTFIDENGEEKTIEVKSISDQNDKPNLLWFKIFYQDTTLGNLDTKMIDQDTGYIYIEHEMHAPFRGALSYLTDDASYLTKAIDKKLEALKSQGMKDLVIDLRANMGGYFTESAAIASLFTNESYGIIKSAKGKSKLYDYGNLKGNGKYADMKVIVLVNSETASAGDMLADLLSKCPNTTLIGFTNTNNSCQSIGGMIYLPNGTSYIQYPIYTDYNEDGTIQIDTDETRVANVKVDEKVELTKNNIEEIVYSEEDYLLKYAKTLLENEK